MRADRVRVEVDLHHPRSRADQRAVPRRPHVQGAAPADDQVRVADQLGGQGRGEPAGDPERPRVAGEQAVRDGRGREQRSGGGAERPQLAAGRARAAARDEHGALRRREQPGDSSTAAGRTGPRRGTAGRGTSGAGAACTSSGRLSTTVRRCSRPSGRPGRRRRPPTSGVCHPLGHRADGGHQRVLVDAEVGADGGRPRVRREHEQRRAALRGLGDAGHGVGEPAAGGGGRLGGGGGGRGGGGRGGSRHQGGSKMVAEGEEPHAAARARGGHGGGRRPLQLPHRPERAGGTPSARCPSGCRRLR